MGVTDASTVYCELIYVGYLFDLSTKKKFFSYFYKNVAYLFPHISSCRFWTYFMYGLHQSMFNIARSFSLPNYIINSLLFCKKLYILRFMCL